MFNRLIPHILSIHNFTKIDAKGNKRNGIRLLSCSLEDTDLTSIAKIEDIIQYCKANDRIIDCYECLDEFKAGICSYGDTYNNMAFYRMHRLKSPTKIQELINLSGKQGYLTYEGRSYCKFVPFIEGSFFIEGDLLCYSGEKRVFILPNDNYRHIDVMFYNKIFINMVTGDIVGRYAGLDENKQFIETEEKWDEVTRRWIVTKKRLTSIAGCKAYM